MQAPYDNTGFITNAVSRVLFPLHEAAKGHHSVRMRRELETTQWWDAAKLEHLQRERLQAFCIRVGRTVPYYQEVFRASGFRPEAIEGTADLQALPLLDKATIRANVEGLRSRSAGRLVRYNTGGSSGEPLVFYMGVDRISHDVAAKWRATRWWGVDIGDPEVVLWGSPIELGRQDRIKALRDRLFRSHLLPAFQMSVKQMDGYLDQIQEIRPRMLFGYASALALLAKHAERRGRDLRGVGAKVVFATGETLFPDQRSVIERVFSAPVANGYGSRDAGFIAHQCPSGSLHMSAEHIIVELLDEGGRPVRPGERGEIVTTHMATGDFPFIRYRTGDMAAMSQAPCSCGRGLPVLAEVLGRSSDFIRTPSGGVMHALALIYEVRDKPGVRAFKFIQDADYSIRLQVLSDNAFTTMVEQQVLQGLARRLGTNVRLTLERVTKIDPERSGKYRYVVSHVDASRSEP